MTVQRNLSRWVDGDANREMVRRTISELESRVSQLTRMLALGKTSIGSNGGGMGLTEFQQRQVLELVAGRSSAVIGQEVVDPLVVGLPTNNGTVTSISFNAAFTGGTITLAGSVTLVIGTANALQKSDGTKLVNSRVTDDGNDIALNSAKKVFLGVTHIMTVDDSAGLVLLNMTALPIVDPGVSGALWNNAGVINVSP